MRKSYQNLHSWHYFRIRENVDKFDDEKMKQSYLIYFLHFSLVFCFQVRTYDFYIVVRLENVFCIHSIPFFVFVFCIVSTFNFQS
jgi:hypothetical protein